MSTILPRLSGDRKQLKTYAKMYKDKNHPYEVKEASFGVTKLAAMAMKKEIRLVFDLEHASLFLTTEEECAKGKQPNTIRFTSSSIGQPYKCDPTTILKNGDAYMSPFRLRVSPDCSRALKEKKILLVQGVKDKGDFLTTVNKCRIIKTLCTEYDSLTPIQTAYAREWRSLNEVQKRALKHYVLINKLILYPLDKIPYWKESIEYAKSKGAKEPEAGIN